VHKYCWKLNHRAIPGELYFDQQEINEAQNAIRESIAFWKSSNPIENKGIIFIESSRIEEKSSKHDKKILINAEKIRIGALKNGIRQLKF
jgi:hypothetical protein